MIGSRAAVCTSALLLFLTGAATISAQPSQAAPRTRVLVQLRTAAPYEPEARLRTAVAIFAQRRGIESAAGRVLARLAGGGHRVSRRYQTVPFVALEVTPEVRAALESSPDVERVVEDEIHRPGLAQSVPLVQGDQAWAAGYDGSGVMIAILDTGVDAQQPFLGGRVMVEACFSSTVAGLSQSTCPNGADQQLGPGAAAPCSVADCVHGTHVAGIAAGNTGVARNARVMAIQVFSIVTNPANCGGIAPCAGAFSSDIIAGLEYVYSAPPTLNVATVNMSLGSTTFSAFCDDQPYKAAIDNLRAIGIASVVASGNSFAGAAISSPACISSAVSVGATTKTNEVALFSNVAPFLSLFAPGEAIRSSTPGTDLAEFSGTSMAAPHVAGAWAVLRQAAPTATVGAVLGALRATGRPITDTRWWGGGTTAPRISVLEALARFVPITNPAPVLAAFAPARLRGGTASAILTLNGSGFNAFSVVLWNGSPRPTTVVSTTQLTAVIPAADLNAASSGLVAVRAPVPGGGTTASFAVPIDPPPSLVPSPLTAAPGARVTVTLANGFGGAGDWIAFAPASAPNWSYLAFTYVGAGVTSRTWSVTVPATPGAYEFRLFLDHGYSRVATSASIVVDAQNPTPPSPAAIAVNAATVAPGASVTMTLTNGPGGTRDWLALASTAAANTAYVAFTYVGAGVASRTWTVAMPSTPGTYEFRLFLNNGYTRAATSPPITVSAGINPVPSIASLNPSRVGAGTAAFTLTVNGSGFASGSEVRWNGSTRPTTFVSATQLRASISAADVAALATAHVTVATPAPGGGTSAAIPFTIGASPSLTASPTTVAPGTPITVTLTDGLGGLYDWLAFAPAGAADTSYITFVFVGGGTTSRTWTVTAPSAPGTYEFRLFLTNGYTRAATSPPIVVQ